MRRVGWVSLCVMLGGASLGAADDSGISSGSGISPQQVQTVQTADGTTVCNAPILEVSNSTLTDNSSTGKCTVTTGSGGAFDATTVDSVTWSDGVNASNVWTFDVSGTDSTFTFGNGTWTLAPGGSDLILQDDLELQDATPHVRYTDTTASEDDFESYAEASFFYVGTNVTDGVVLAYFDPQNKFYLPNLANCDTVDTDALGGLICGTDATGAGGGDALTVATVAATDPDFIDSSRIDVTLNTVPAPDTITWDVVADSIDAVYLADVDFGDFTCADGSGGCLVDANAVALGTDTTNNYVATIADAGNSTVTVANSGTETAAVTLDVIDVNCTDCLGATEIADSYVLNTGDGMTGDLDLDGSNINITLQHTGADEFGLHTEAGSIFYINNTTDGVIYWQAQASHGVRYGDASVPNHVFSTTSTGNDTVQLPLGAIGSLEILDASIAAADVSTDIYTNPVRELWVPCVASLAVEAADSIPPLNKDAGTNLDQLTCAYDATTDEGRTFVLKMPSDLDTATGATARFRAYWYALTATSGAALWEARSNGGTAQGTDPDGTLTVEAAAAATTQGTAGQLTITTWNAPIARLAWVANDLVYLVLYRNADGSGDTLAEDAQLIGLSVEVPVN